MGWDGMGWDGMGWDGIRPGRPILFHPAPRRDAPLGRLLPSGWHAADPRRDVFLIPHGTAAPSPPAPSPPGPVSAGGGAAYLAGTPAADPMRLLPLAVLTTLLAGAACWDAAPLPVAAARIAAGSDASVPSDSARALRLRAVGDVMIGTDFPAGYLPPGGRSVLTGVHDLLRDADLTFANLEGPFLDGGTSTKCAPTSTQCYAFRTPTRYGQYLVDAGIDLASLANNHAQDFGEAGRTSTMAMLDRLGIAHSGRAGTVASVVKNGTRVALVAYHAADHSNFLNDEPAAARFIAEVARTHDVVVVSFHGGAEGGRIHVPEGRETFLGEDRGDLRLFAHTVVDAGADLVLGSGPHVPRGVELYRGRLIAYSLGNFATYGRFTIRGATALAPVLDVTLGPDGAFASGRILSARQVGEGIPEADPSGEVVALMRSLSADDFPGSEATVEADGRIVRRAAAPADG